MISSIKLTYVVVTFCFSTNIRKICLGQSINSCRSRHSVQLNSNILLPFTVACIELQSGCSMTYATRISIVLSGLTVEPRASQNAHCRNATAHIP